MLAKLAGEIGKLSGKFARLLESNALHLTPPIASVPAMSRPVAMIQQEIRDLSLAEKEEALRTLLEELDGPPDLNVEATWLRSTKGLPQFLG